MAYVETHSARRQTGVLVAVALLHGAVGLAVVSAFAGGVVKDNWNHWVAPPRIDDAPRATPTPEPLHTRPASKPPKDSFQPQPPIDLGTGPSITVTNFPLDPLPMPTLTAPPIDVVPSTPPSLGAGLATKAARPLGKPGLWVTNDDYPSGALRRGEQGVTAFTVTVGPDGRVRDCMVTRSSGSEELDRTTCAKVTARARFAPATDAGGGAVTGSYGNSIRWEIPNQP